MQTCSSCHWHIIQKANYLIISFTKGFGVLTRDAPQHHLVVRPYSNRVGSTGSAASPRPWAITTLERCYLPAAPACLKHKSWLNPWTRRHSWTVWCQTPLGNAVEQSELASKRELGGRSLQVPQACFYTFSHKGWSLVFLLTWRGTKHSIPSTALRAFTQCKQLMLHEAFSPPAVLCAGGVALTCSHETGLHVSFLPNRPHCLLHLYLLHCTTITIHRAVALEHWLPQPPSPPHGLPHAWDQATISSHTSALPVP